MDATARPSERAHHRVDLETAAGLGCLKCLNEYETGEKNTRVHDDACPRKRPPFYGAAAAAAAQCAPAAAPRRKRPHPAAAAPAAAAADATVAGPADAAAPRRVGHSIEFPLAALTRHLVCSLCSGYLRDPHTVTDCLHAFCRSCLLLFFRRGARCCPTCRAHLAPDPFQTCVRPDRTLQDVIDKIFPGLAAAEEEEERVFYEQRGIALKPEYRQEAKAEHGQGRGRVQTSPGVTEDLLLDLKLEPDGQPPHARQRLPPLHNPLLRTAGRLKVSSIKKYLLRRLGLPTPTKAAIELLCNGDPMGDELSLTFIVRTRWFSAERMLTLHYRWEEEGAK